MKKIVDQTRTPREKPLKQNIRVWFNYLQTAIKWNGKIDPNSKTKEVFNFPINKDYYRSWNLSQVRSLKFDKWYVSHKHLFANKKYISVKVSDSLSYEDAIKEVKKQLINKVGKTSQYQMTNTRFRYLEVDDYLKHFKLRYADKHKHNILQKYTYIGTRIYNQQIKSVAKRMKSASTKMISRDKFVAKNPDDFTDEVYLRMIKRKVDTATKILDNVASGRFTGDYT